MIIIVAKSTVPAENTDRYIAAAEELVAKSRAEEGNISYRLCRSLKDSSLFTFIEEWQSQEAIALHNTSEHFTRIVPLLAELRSSSEIELYEVSI